MENRKLSDLPDAGPLQNTDLLHVVRPGADPASRKATIDALPLGAVAAAQIAAKQPINANLTSIAALATTGYGRGLLTAPDAASLRTSAGLGSLASLNAINDANWSGADLAITNGGTGASTAGAARTALGVAIGADVQAHDATLTAVAGLSTAADRLPYFTGVDSAALADFPSVGRTLVAQTTQGAARTTGLGMTANGSSLVTAADYPAMKTLLSLNNVDNTSDANKPVSTAQAAADALKAPIASPTFTGTVTLPGDPSSALHAATKQYVDQIVAAQDAMVFKGVIDCSANPNYPAADRGWIYRVSVAGKIGGASGTVVEAGDFMFCLTDGTASGNQATVGSAWSVVQGNLDGALTTASIGESVQAYDADLSAVAALSTTGLIARTGAGAVAARTVTGTANEITVTNGDGVSGNPTLSLPAALTFTGKTITGGTFATSGFTGVATFSGGVRFALENTAWTFDDASSARLAIVKKGGALPGIAFASGQILNFYASSASDLTAAVTGQTLTTCASVTTAGIELPTGKYISTNGVVLARNGPSNYTCMLGGAGNGALTGAQNVGVGQTTLGALTSGSDNAAFGGYTLVSLTTGVRNSALGPEAGRYVTTGNYNVVAGSAAGDTITSGSNNTIFGFGADVNGGAASYRTVIGSGASGTIDNSVTLGRAADTVVVPGGRVVFPSTAVPSADPNTLDDYREASFTPTFKFGGGAATGWAFTVYSGTFTKIGRLAVVTFDVAVATKGSATGAVTVSNIPAAAANTGGCGTLTVGVSSGPELAYVLSGNDLFLYNSAGSALTHANLDVNSRFWMSIVYPAG